MPRAPSPLVFLSQGWVAAEFNWPALSGLKIEIWGNPQGVIRPNGRFQDMAALAAKRRMLDIESPSEDENARLRPLPDVKVEPGTEPIEIHLEPYGIEFWFLEPLNWQAQLMGR
ncbi:MAG: hypothetical protein ABSC47_00275 [Terracidiphilus sp.]|jgi:hypothetical protein